MSRKIKDENKSKAAHKTPVVGDCAVGVIGQVVLPTFDATALVGFKTVICNAAYEMVDDDGDVVIEVPHIRQLLASAAVVRCLMPEKLRGHELRAMRKIMRLTLSGLAERLGANTATETLSRWETESQPIGGYAEKVVRLLVCDELNKEAVGVGYGESMIAKLRVVDPWITNKNYVVPAVTFDLVKMKEQSGPVVDAYSETPKVA